MKPKAIIVFSGGQDSTTCLYQAIADGFDPHLVSFNYGQRHSRELGAAIKISELAGVPPNKRETIHMEGILRGASPLVDQGAKLEQYINHTSLPGGLEKTFVPMRNQLFLTLAANRASVLGTNVMYTGVCQEDFGGYPDCRQEFITALAHASSLGTFTDKPLEIRTPLMNLTKAQSVQLALTLPGCYHALAHSHTAYDGAYPPIGKDHATLLREKGFVEAGVPDPLVLRAVTEGLMQLPDLPNYKLRAREMGEYYGLAGL